MNDKKDNVAFTKEGLIKKLNEQNKSEVVVWDDAGLWLHKKDTIEKIKEDAIKIVEEFNDAMEAPDLMWTSSYSSLRKIHIQNMFLIMMVQIISRINAVTKTRKEL